MRTRRQFRPVFDHLTLRIAPSGGVCQIRPKVSPARASSSGRQPHEPDLHPAIWPQFRVAVRGTCGLDLTESADHNALLNHPALTFHNPFSSQWRKTSFFQVGDHSQRMVATLMARPFPLAPYVESLSIFEGHAQDYSRCLKPRPISGIASDTSAFLGYMDGSRQVSRQIRKHS